MVIYVLIIMCVINDDAKAIIKATYYIYICVCVCVCVCVDINNE